MNKTKFTIAVLTDNLKGHGGEETVLRLFSDYLSDSYNFEMIFPSLEGKIDWLDSFRGNRNKVYYNRKQSRLSKYIFVEKMLVKTNIDILICMTPQLTYFASIIRKIFRKKYKIISWQHFSIFRPTDKSSASKKKKWYSSADYYFAISSGIKKELISLKINPDRIFTIFNPIIPIDKPISKKKSDATHFLCIARIQFNQQKNLQDLFDACQKLRGNWILDIYGNDDSEGNIEIAKCKNYVKKLGIEKRVIWHGWVEDVWSEDICPSCLVLTSNFEGFPMSLCEAASHGIPLIAADCPTGPEDIVNAQNGYLYQMHHIEKLINLMQRFIDGNVNFDIKLVKESVSKFYVDNYIKKVKNSIEKIIEENNEK